MELQSSKSIPEFLYRIIQSREEEDDITKPDGEESLQDYCDRLTAIKEQYEGQLKDIERKISLFEEDILKNSNNSKSTKSISSTRTCNCKCRYRKIFEPLEIEREILEHDIKDKLMTQRESYSSSSTGSCNCKCHIKKMYEVKAVIDENDKGLDSPIAIYMICYFKNSMMEKLEMRNGKWLDELGNTIENIKGKEKQEGKGEGSKSVVRDGKLLEDQKSIVIKKGIEKKEENQEMDDERPILMENQRKIIETGKCTTEKDENEYDGSKLVIREDKLIEDSRKTIKKEGVEKKNKEKEKLPKYPKFPDNSPFVVLGPYSTKILKRDFNMIDWSNARPATRSLLNCTFTLPVFQSCSNVVMKRYVKHMERSNTNCIGDAQCECNLRIEFMIYADLICCVRSQCRVPYSVARCIVSSEFNITGLNI